MLLEQSANEKNIRKIKSKHTTKKQQAKLEHNTRRGRGLPPKDQERSLWASYPKTYNPMTLGVKP